MSSSDTCEFCGHALTAHDDAGICTKPDCGCKEQPSRVRMRPQFSKYALGPGGYVVENVPSDDSGPEPCCEVPEWTEGLDDE